MGKREPGNRKLRSTTIVVVLVFTSFLTIDFSFDFIQNVEAPGPITIYVDDDAPNDPGPNSTMVSDPLEDGSLDHPFDMIQEGVNAANHGDTVFVFSGHYGGANLNKTINFVGENKETTILGFPPPFPSSASTVDIVANWTNMTGFTVNDRGNGIYVTSSFNNISGNIVRNITESGIELFSSHQNLISNNLFYDNWKDIYILGESGKANNFYHTITGNVFNDSDEGINIEFANRVFINDNTFLNNTYGINLHRSEWHDIENNYFFNNSQAIFFFHINYDINVTRNTLIHNSNGIMINGANVERIKINENLVMNNDHGIGFFMGSPGSMVYHNDIIKNGQQAEGPAQWDNDYPSGGNFWSDYDGVDSFSGPNQDIPGSDGIGDTPYINFVTDNYPIMDPIGRHLRFASGWNFVSIPNIQPDTDASKILGSIKDNYSALQYYDSSDALDPWKHYHGDKPSELNDLQEIDHFRGFWIKVTEPQGIIYESLGTPPQVNQSIQLYEGWNMVGYPSYSKYNRTDGLNNLVYGNEVDAVWTYNARNQNWEDIIESDHFVKGYGYWIHAITDCVWEVPL